jgi:hypothetical protein
MELLDKGRQGSDGWGNVQLRNAWQGGKECNGNECSERSTLA